LELSRDPRREPASIYWLLGSYLPFPRTPAERQAIGDPRRSVTERYRDRDDYLARIRAAAAELVKGGYLLQQDLTGVDEHAKRHWDDRMTPAAVTPGSARH
jgi:hypothetical protein